MYYIRNNSQHILIFSNYHTSVRPFNHPLKRDIVWLNTEFYLICLTLVDNLRLNHSFSCDSDRNSCRKQNRFNYRQLPALKFWLVDFCACALKLPFHQFVRKNDRWVVYAAMVLVTCLYVNSLNYTVFYA